MSSRSHSAASTVPPPSYSSERASDDECEDVPLVRHLKGMWVTSTGMWRLSFLDDITGERHVCRIGVHNTCWCKLFDPDKGGGFRCPYIVAVFNHISDSKVSWKEFQAFDSPMYPVSRPELSCPACEEKATNLSDMWLLCRKCLRPWHRQCAARARSVHGARCACGEPVVRVLECVPCVEADPHDDVVERHLDEPYAQVLCASDAVQVKDFNDFKRRITDKITKLRQNAAETILVSDVVTTTGSTTEVPLRGMSHLQQLLSQLDLNPVLESHIAPDLKRHATLTVADIIGAIEIKVAEIGESCGNNSAALAFVEWKSLPVPEGGMISELRREQWCESELSVNARIVV